MRHKLILGACSRLNNNHNPRPHLQQSSFITGRAFQTLFQLPSFHVVHSEKNTHTRISFSLQLISVQWRFLSILTWCFGPDRRWRRASSMSPGPCRTESSSPPRGDSWRTKNPPPSGPQQTWHHESHTGENNVFCPELIHSIRVWIKPTQEAQTHGYFFLYLVWVQTDLFSCLEVDALVGSTAHHSNIWTLTWNTGNTG